MDIFDAQSAKPMLIGSVEQPFDSPDHVFELKLDGERCIAYLNAESTTLVNRRGKRVLPQFPELTALHQAVGSHRCVIDGELIINEGRKQDFELIKQRALSKNPFTIKRLSSQHPAFFVALDLLYIDGELLVDAPLTERQTLLRQTVEEAGRFIHIRQIDNEGLAFFTLVRGQGLEGIVAKRKNSVYRMGKRSKDWLKIKNWIDDVFVICGYVPSENAAVISLVLGQYDNSDKLVYKGRVTLGKNRPDFAAVNALPARKNHPFSEPPPEHSPPAIWLQPRLVCRVGFMCWTTNRKLRQPFYKEMMQGMDPLTVREHIPNEYDTSVCVG